MMRSMTTFLLFLVNAAAFALIFAWVKATSGPSR